MPLSQISSKKPLLSLSAKVREPITLKLCIVKLYKLRRIYELQPGVLRKSSYYTQFQSRKFISAQKYIIELKTFPTPRKNKLVYVPSRAHQQIRKLDGHAFEIFRSGMLRLNSDAFKRLKEFTVFISWSMVLKRLRQFYSRSLTFLSLSIVLSSKQKAKENFKAIFQILSQRVPCIKKITLSISTLTMYENNQPNIWESLLKFRNLESVSLILTKASSCTEIECILPEVQTDICFTLNLGSSFFESSKLEQLQHFADKVNNIRKFQLTIIIKWDDLSQSSMKHLLYLLQHFSHKVSFIVEKGTSFGSQKSWIYDFLDEMYNYREKILRWNAFIFADVIDDVHLESIVKNKDNLASLEITVWHPFSTENINNKNKLFNALRGVKNLENLKIELNLDPEFENKGWKLDSFVMLLKTIADNITDYQGRLEVEITFRDSKNISLYEDLTEDEISQIWVQLKRFNQMVHFRVSSAIINERVANKILRGMFYTCKSFKNLERFCVESRLGQDSVGFIQNELKELYFYCKAIRSVKLTIEVNKVQQNGKDIDDKQIVVPENLYVWVDFENIIRLPDENITDVYFP